MAARAWSRWITAAAMAAAVHGAAATARAHSGGQPGGGCNGCHGPGDYAISATASPASFDPGDEVTVTVTFAAAGASEGGIFVSSNAGSMSTLGGEGLAEVAQGLTHSAPKSTAGGAVSFSFAWKAPSSPGAVRFEVWTVAANGNGSSSGDKAGEADFDFVYGCAPATYYRDLDGDGFGRDSDTMVHCAGTAPAGYVADGADCNDNNQDVFPGATEVCNDKDDDCDEIVDEDAVPLDLYLDEDGDGYYGNAEKDLGVQGVGCVPAQGLAGYPGDCQPTIAEINPGAEEVCNLFDDDCDGDYDEKVRPRCGVGWCERESETCDPAGCTPGEPQPERCNLFDDDCDENVDEGPTCDGGQTCVAGECLEDGAAAGSGSGAGAGASGHADGGASDGGCSVGERPSSAFAAGLAAVVMIGVWRARRRQHRRICVGGACPGCSY
jgi:MYXO-CTERM domain-containing protein